MRRWCVGSSSLIGKKDHISGGGAVATGDEPCCDVLDVVDAAVELVGGVEVVDAYEEGFSANAHCHCRDDTGVGNKVLAITDGVLTGSMACQYMVFMIRIWLSGTFDACLNVALSLLVA